MKLQNNWPLLNGLRFLLALIVLGSHLDGARRGSPYLNFFLWFDPHAAVLAFLLISGFSIAHSYERNPNGFYMRRIERIMPLFLFAFLLATLPFVAAGLDPDKAILEPPATMWEFLLNALPVQTWLVKPLSTNLAAWSLGVEAFLYCLAPWFARCNRKQIMSLIGASVFFFATSGFWGMEVHYLSLSPLVPVALLWVWLLGWVIYKERNNLWLQRFAPLFACACLGMHTEGAQPLAYVTLGGCAALLVFQSEVAVPAKAVKWLNYGGELSYPLYIVHAPMIALGSTLWTTAVRSEWLFLLTFPVALFAYHCVDAPLRKRAGGRTHRPGCARDAGALTAK